MVEIVSPCLSGGHRPRVHESYPSPASTRYAARMSEPRPLVGVIMGSSSDWETMRHACESLDTLGIPHEKRVVSAHRTPDLLFEYASTRPALVPRFSLRTL